MDGIAKILKENRTARNWPSLAETAVTEFRVRCFQPTAASVAHHALVYRKLIPTRMPAVKFEPPLRSRGYPIP
jgi:hypothetical protein